MILIILSTKTTMNAFASIHNEKDKEMRMLGILRCNICTYNTHNEMIDELLESMDEKDICEDRIWNDWLIVYNIRQCANRGFFVKLCYKKQSLLTTVPRIINYEFLHSLDFKRIKIELLSQMIGKYINVETFDKIVRLIEENNKNIDLEIVFSNIQIINIHNSSEFCTKVCKYFENNKVYIQKYSDIIVKMIILWSHIYQKNIINTLHDIFMFNEEQIKLLNSYHHYVNLEEKGELYEYLVNNNCLHSFEKTCIRINRKKKTLDDSILSKVPVSKNSFSIYNKLKKYGAFVSYANIINSYYMWHNVVISNCKYINTLHYALINCKYDPSVKPDYLLCEAYKENDLKYILSTEHTVIYDYVIYAKTQDEKNYKNSRLYLLYITKYKPNEEINNLYRYKVI